MNAPLTIKPLPTLVITGPKVDARTCSEPGTGGAFMLACLWGLLVGLAMTLVTYGIALIAFLLSPLWSWFMSRKAMALIRGSGVRIDEVQLAEIHRCIATFSERLGMAEPPEAYLIEANVSNAAAVRYGRRNVILLTDDLVDACLRSPRPECLAWVIGHELAHIALGHTGMFRSTLRRIFKKLGRLDEHSADRVATRLVNDNQIAFTGLMSITTGPQVMPYIDPQALIRQATEVVKDSYTAKAEKTLTHPLLLNRLHRVLNQRID
jgi:hypothetical protein